MNSVGRQPKIESIDGDYEVDTAHHTLHWRIPIIDSDNTQGGMEFSIAGDDANAFFPISIRWKSDLAFCGVDVGVQG